MLFRSLRRQGKALEKLEESLARGTLNTVDDGSDDQVLIQWIMAHLPGNLETDLAACSDNLDKVAFTVDSVEGIKESRLLKKEISKQIVVLMERADALVHLYKKWKQNMT